jgi:hypothetical protein
VERDSIVVLPAVAMLLLTTVVWPRIVTVAVAVRIELRPWLLKAEQMWVATVVVVAAVAAVAVAAMVAAEEEEVVVVAGPVAGGLGLPAG